MKETIKYIIDSIIDEKIKKNAVPLNAEFIDIQNRLMEMFKHDMREMLDNGEIKAYRTLNGTAIERVN